MSPAIGRAITAAATVVPLLGVTLSTGWDDVVPQLLALVAVAIGWVIGVHDPRSPVGPALAWTSSAVALVGVNDVLTASAYTDDPLPLGDLLAPLALGVWPLNLAGLLALLLVFPDGRLVWRAIPWAYAAATVAMVYGQWGGRQVNGRIEGEPEGSAHLVAMLTSIVTVAVCLVLAVASQVVRYRRGDERTRLRIRWLALSGAVVVISLMGGWMAEPFVRTDVAYTPFLAATIVLVPISVGIAIVRHDLFDIDRILSGSAAWLVTLVVAAAAFAGVVVMVSDVFAAQLGQAVAAFVTALVLLPLHRYVAALVARLLDRDRHVAVSAIRRFAAQVRAGERQPEEIEDVLRQAQRDPDLAIALAHPEGSWVDIAGNSIDVPSGIDVESGGDVIARVTLGWESARARRRIAELVRVAWVSIEVARSRLLLREALNRLAVAAAEERKRLERELHDGVQQRLIATGMRLRLLERGMDSSQAGEVDTAVAELEETVVELRRLAHGVRPTRLDDGLGPALEAVRLASPLPIDLDVEPLPAADEARTLTAYLVVSEAVTNALKHAGASRITVRVGGERGRLAVEICDDGIGGVTAPLPAIRDRVASVGGQFSVVSPAGVGTTVRAVL